MKSFSCIHKRYWLPARYYKVYVCGDQLLFGRMPGSKNEDTIRVGSSQKLNV